MTFNISEQLKILTKQSTLGSQTVGPLDKYVSEFCYLKSMTLGCRIIIFEMIGKKEKLEGAVVMHSFRKKAVNY